MLLPIDMILGRNIFAAAENGIPGIYLKSPSPAELGRGLGGGGYQINVEFTGPLSPQRPYTILIANLLPILTVATGGTSVPRKF